MHYRYAAEIEQDEVEAEDPEVKQFNTIYDELDGELKDRKFKQAKPESGAWDIHGKPWIYEINKYQIWVYCTPQWLQQEVTGQDHNYHSITGHLQRGKILDRFEFKPRSLDSLKSYIPKALAKVDKYLEAIEKSYSELWFK